MDLRPFRKLLSVLGMLRCAPDELPALLRRMPRRLESLCLTAENLPEPRDFDVGECASAAGMGVAGRLESGGPVARACWRRACRSRLWRVSLIPGWV